MDVLPAKSLPVGYRFRPTDEELIDHYLRLKINGFHKEVSVIREVDVCKKEPWDLPDLSVVESIDNEWFFFCPKDRKYQNGQRLNRATVAGYWKATGKDRMIKSGKGGTNVIGRKKTLVFYTGRAPRGERTNWVIHEYCATDQALDGTHPGQSAFVLCRLFKKHDVRVDEHAESSNCDEVDPNVDSPSIVKSSAEDIQSEPVTPMPDGQTGLQPKIIESCKPENAEKTSLDPPSLLDWHSTSCNTDDAEDQGIDMTSIQPDPDLEKALRDFYDPTADSKIFSPLHSQMQLELGTSYLYNPGADNFGINHNGLEYQYGTNDMDMVEFLDSILVDGDEISTDNFSKGTPSAAIETSNYINSSERVFVNKESGSCSESEGEVAQGQVYDPLASQGWLYMENIQKSLPATMGGASGALVPPKINLDEHLPNAVHGNNILNKNAAMSIVPADYPVNLVNAVESFSGSNSIVDSGNDFGTGIKIRPRRPKSVAGAQTTATQGSANKRIRFQTKLQVGPVCCIPSNGANLDKENRGDKPTPVEAENAVEKGLSVSDVADFSDESSEISTEKSNAEGEVDPVSVTALAGGISDETSYLQDGKSNTEGKVDLATGFSDETSGLSTEKSSIEGEIDQESIVSPAAGISDATSDLLTEESNIEGEVDQESAVTISDKTSSTSTEKSNTEGELDQASSLNVKATSFLPAGRPEKVWSFFLKALTALSTIQYMSTVLLVVGLLGVSVGIWGRQVL